METLEKIWPEWEIVKELGAGSFGKVYEIKRTDTGREFHAALKVISIPKNQNEVKELISEGMDEQSTSSYFYEMVEEIVNEFDIMEQLKGNTNIVAYEDHKVIAYEDRIGWDILIRMELLTPLNSYTANRRLSEQDVAKLGVDICRALELCKRQSIIHRDIKLENIFVSKYGDYKLGDFGIARTVERSTMSMSKKGTYTYMAPEVYAGKPYNASVDLYSLGIVLYRLLNDNRAPFMPQAPTPISYSDSERAQTRRFSGEILPPPAHAGNAFYELIKKACAFDPAQRFASPEEMRTALEDVMRTSADTSQEEKDLNSTSDQDQNYEQDMTVSMWTESTKEKSKKGEVVPDTPTETVLDVAEDIGAETEQQVTDSQEKSKSIEKKKMPRRRRVRLGIEIAVLMVVVLTAVISIMSLNRITAEKLKGRYTFYGDDTSVDYEEEFLSSMKYRWAEIDQRRYFLSVIPYEMVFSQNQTFNTPVYTTCYLKSSDNRNFRIQGICTCKNGKVEIVDYKINDDGTITYGETLLTFEVKYKKGELYVRSSELSDGYVGYYRYYSR